MAVVSLASSGSALCNPADSLIEDADKTLLKASQDGAIQELAIKALSQKDAAGMVTIGQRYEKGDGVAQSEELAIRWYRRAIVAGSTSAKMRLVGLDTLRMVDGKPCLLDYPERCSLVSEAAAEGDAEAMFSMAGRPSLCSDGTVSDLENESANSRWRRRASDAGYAKATWELLHLYSTSAWTKMQLQLKSDGGSMYPALDREYGKGTCLGKEIRDGVSLEVQTEEEVRLLMHRYCLEQVHQDEEYVQTTGNDKEKLQQAVIHGLERLCLLNSLQADPSLEALCQQYGLSAALSGSKVSKEVLDQIQLESLRRLAADLLLAEKSSITRIFARADVGSANVQWILACWMQSERPDGKGGEERFKMAYPFHVAAANQDHPISTRRLKWNGYDNLVSSLERAAYQRMKELSQTEDSSSSEEEEDCSSSEEEGFESDSQKWVRYYIGRLKTFLDKNPEYPGFRELLAAEDRLLKLAPELKTLVATSLAP